MSAGGQEVYIPGVMGPATPPAKPVPPPRPSLIPGVTGPA